MLRLRKASILPHPASAWWILALLGLGWLPLWIADLLGPKQWETAEGFGMAWGIAVALPCTCFTVVSVLTQACRLLAHLMSRPPK